MSARSVFLAHSSDWPPRSGDGVHTWEMAAGLARRGFRVTSHRGTPPPGVVRAGPGRASLARAVLGADLLYLRVDGALAREWLSVLGAMRKRPRVLWEVNGSLDEQVAHGLDGPGLRRLRATRRTLARAADAAIVVSPELLPYAHEELRIADVTVIENGGVAPTTVVDLPPVLQGRFVAWWSGSAHYPWQAVDSIVAAARLLCERAPDIVFGLLTADLPAGLHRLPANVVLLPPAGHDAVTAMAARADVGLCAYHRPAWTRHGLYMSPLKLFDAWAAGVAVVATDTGSLRRLVDDGVTGLLVPDDAEALAAAVLRLRDDATLRASIAAAGHALYLERYNWDRAADETAAVLHRLLGAG